MLTETLLGVSKNKCNKHLKTTAINHTDGYIKEEKKLQDKKKNIDAKSSKRLLRIFLIFIFIPSSNS